MIQSYSISLVIIGVITVLSSLSLVQADVFTALTDVEKLIDTEGVLIEILRGFVEQQETMIEELQKNLEILERDHIEIVKDLSNPLNAFILIKRLTIDWVSMENKMRNDTGSEYLETMSENWKNLTFPAQEDLEGAAMGLVRLQETYELETNSIAKGIINGVQYVSVLSSSDCFELGKQSFITGNNQNTIKWMEEAMDRLVNETKIGVESASEVDILELIAFAKYKSGDVETALAFTEELLKLQPNHEKARNNKEFFEHEIAEHKNNSPAEPKEETKFIDAGLYLTNILCRGDFKASPSFLRPLRCRYVSRGSPFLKIAPFKLEEIQLEPYIIVFHGILSDREIESMKKTAIPRLERSGVQNNYTNETTFSFERISKYAWFDDNALEFGSVLSQRTEDMTGLTTRQSEKWQILNYGIGGFYRHHHDFTGKIGASLFDKLGSGDRIATVIFYLSDVEQGGATVFPIVGASVSPRKGSALFWYNLHESGEPDYRTVHAGCPVLIGSKWIANKWFHERGQEFRRPCGLADDTLLPEDFGWTFGY